MVTSFLEKPLWAKAIQSRRESLGVSQERLALEMDISPSLITKIERGAHDFRKMKLENFYALLEALNWTIADFESSTGVAMPIFDRKVKTNSIKSELKTYSTEELLAELGQRLEAR